MFQMSKVTEKIQRDEVYYLLEEIEKIRDESNYIIGHNKIDDKAKSFSFEQS